MKHENTLLLTILFKIKRNIFLSLILLVLLIWNSHILNLNKIQIKIYFSKPVSVIIPIYNKFSYLNLSMNSIQSQTLNKIEIICIDDFSTDKSVEFILNRMKKDFRIMLIKNLYNQGTCLTRINGVLSATGDYIFSFDPDDLVTPTAIEYNYKLATNLNADIIDYRIKAKSPNKIKHNYCPCRHNYTDNKGILERLKTYTINWNLCKKLIRRTIYLKAITLIYPFIEGKRIIAAEDLLHCGAIFFFVKMFICSKHLTYIYFLDTPDSSGSGKNQPLEQNFYQLYYIRSIIQYFLNEKDGIMNCTPDKLFAQNKTVWNLYNNITNITDKTPKTNCNINIDGFYSQNYSEKGYCAIMNYK